MVKLLTLSGINPQEIEDAIIQTELVVEAAVIGIKDELLGNKLIAFVSPKDKTTDASMGSVKKISPLYSIFIVAFLINSISIFILLY